VRQGPGFSRLRRGARSSVPVGTRGDEGRCAWPSPAIRCALGRLLGEKLPGRAAGPAGSGPGRVGAGGQPGSRGSVGRAGEGLPFRDRQPQNLGKGARAGGRSADLGSTCATGRSPHGRGGSGRVSTRCFRACHRALGRRTPRFFRRVEGGSSNRAFRPPRLRGPGWLRRRLLRLDASYRPRRKLQLQVGELEGSYQGGPRPGARKTTRWGGFLVLRHTRIVSIYLKLKHAEIDNIIDKYLI